VAALSTAVAVFVALPQIDMRSISGSLSSDIEAPASSFAIGPANAVVLSRTAEPRFHGRKEALTGKA
jgi:hypothetical protein